jgi:hypothetical protein
MKVCSDAVRAYVMGNRKDGEGEVSIGSVAVTGEPVDEGRFACLVVGTRSVRDFNFRREERRAYVVAVDRGTHATVREVPFE